MRPRGLVVVASLLSLSSNLLLAVPPTIHVEWDDGGSPVLNSDYTISTASGADYPNVALLADSLTWQIYSTDSDNPNNIGDIGIVSSPASINVKVRIQDNSNNPGARDCKGITLVPTSSSNYSRLVGGTLTGNLEGNLTVQKSSGGTGGDVDDFTIEGNISSSCTATIPVLTDLAVEGDWAGTGNITSAVKLTIDENVSGSLDITDLTDGDHQGLNIGGGITSSGSLSIEEIGVATPVTIIGDVAASGSFEIGDSLGESTLVNIGGDVLGDVAITGTMTQTYLYID